jgi:hypothetical protein
MNWTMVLAILWYWGSVEYSSCHSLSVRSIHTLVLVDTFVQSTRHRTSGQIKVRLGRSEL